MNLAVNRVPWVTEVLVFLGFMFGVGLAGAQVSLCPKLLFLRSDLRMTQAWGGKRWQE